MSDNKLPKIPSFEELGISSDELEELERELAGEARPADREAAAPAGGAGAGASAGTESAAAEGRADAGARPPKEKAAGARPPKEKAAGRIPRGWRAWRGPLTIAFLAFAAWFSAPSRSLPLSGRNERPGVGFFVSTGDGAPSADCPLPPPARISGALASARVPVGAASRDGPRVHGPDQHRSHQPSRLCQGRDG